jgi:hypothetical protein
MISSSVKGRGVMPARFRSASMMASTSGSGVPVRAPSG